MPLIHLVNPNTSQATTEMMLALARSRAPSGLMIEPKTARFGAALIVDADALALAEAAVLDLAPELVGDGVIVAAFGDPGADALRRRLHLPVIGIGEASIRAAASGGRRFSIATTTPGLEAAIRSRVEMLGFHKQFASLRLTTVDPVAITADARALEAALFALVELCSLEDGAEAVVIGGGPLAQAARALAGRTRASIIEAVPEAVLWMARHLG